MFCVGYKMYCVLCVMQSNRLASCADDAGPRPALKRGGSMEKPDKGLPRERSLTSLPEESAVVTPKFWRHFQRMLGLLYLRTPLLVSRIAV